MIDITFCSGDDCPLRYRCYRFTAEVSGRRNFFTKPPYRADEQSCTSLMSNQQQLKTIAYYLWQEAGCPDKDEQTYWLKAEEEIIRRKS